MKSFIFVLPLLLGLALSMSHNYKNTPNSVNGITIQENLHSENENFKYVIADSSEEGDSSDNQTDNPPGSPLKNVSDMFNERGYYKSNGFSFDNQEIINDFNGNLIYSIPLYNYALGGDLNLNMKLTYNGSISHTLTVGSVSNANIQQNRLNNRYTMNFPEWILDINGFAVQVFNFETNFFDSTGGSELSGSNVNAVIPGYHFDNELREVSSSNKDRINIMAGDGSIISMENENFEANNLGNNYIGNYSYKGKELHYKAIVTYTGEGIYAGYKERNMILLTGDGLEYYFEEKKKNFEDYRTNNIVNARINPMMMYLKQIRDRFGRIMYLGYSSVIPFSISGTDIIMGRDLFESVSFSGISPTISGVGITLLYGQGGVKLFHQSELNGNYTFFFERPVNYRPSGDYKNQRANISKIINILNQKTEIEYGVYARTYTSVYNPFASSSNTLTLNLNDLRRVRTVTNNLGLKREYTYFWSNSDAISLIPYLTGEDNRKYIRSDSGAYKGMGRDPFFTNMLSSRLEYTGVLKSTSSFSYEYNFNNRSDLDEVPVKETDVYETKRTIFYNNRPLWDSSANFRVHREYKVYPLYDSANHFAYSPDTDGSTKLIKEEIKDYGNEVISLKKDEFTYELGSFSSLPQGYNGSFLMRTKKETHPGSSQYNEWKWQYTYKDNDTNKLVYLTRKTDPFNNYTETKDTSYFIKYWHKKFISDYVYTSGFDSSYYYKINIPLIQTRHRQTGETLQKKTFQYIEQFITLDTVTNNGYFGQLISEKTYKSPSFSEYIETKYEYCKNDTSGKYIFDGTGIFPYKEGNLKLIRTNDRETRYYYNPIFLSEVYKSNIAVGDLPPGIPYLKFKVKYNNGNTVESNELIWDHRLPVRIENNVIVNNTTITLSTIYKSYTLDGSPSKMIDQNKYLTQFKYEPIHRINSITLPGDFSTSLDSVALEIDTHYMAVNLNFISSGLGNFNSNTNIVDYYTGNSFGTLRGCGIFKTDINYSIVGSHLYSFIKFDADQIRNFQTVDSAIFDFTAQQFVAIYDNSTISQNDYNTYVRAITNIGSSQSGQTCSPGYKASATIHNYNKLIELNTYAGSSSCNFSNYHKRFDIKELLQNLNSNSKYLKGITISNVFTGGIIEPHVPQFLLNFTYCNYSTEPDLTVIKPKLNVYGKYDYSDTLKIPIIKGGTIKYYYDDEDHTVDVYSMRNTTNNDRSRIKYFIDELGNVKQKDIYTGESSVNSYKYKFNYLNNPAVIVDALNDSTLMFYDGLDRLVRTINPDASLVKNSYSYTGSFRNYFGSVGGVVMFQRFTDEEGNHFDKYTDAVGNLRREVKYIQDDNNIEALTSLTTDYKYDSLYRVMLVRTPQEKNIYYYYDGYGRQSKRITPDAGQTDYIYDKNNNLIFSQDANQRAVGTSTHPYTFRNYDGLNRLTGIGEASFQIESPNDGEQYRPSTSTDYLTINVYDTLTSSIVTNLFTAPSGYTSPLYTKGNLVATAYRTKPNENWSFKYYRYDQRGRVVKMWNVIADFDTLITYYFYNSQDQVTTYSHSGMGDAKTYRNTYDNAGRLSKAEYYIGEPDIPVPNYVNFVEYDYNENSQISQYRFNEGSFKNNFYYNNRTWITNFQNNDGLFEYENTYFKNGNVKTQYFAGDYNDRFANPSDLNFTSTYDKSNRLLKTTGTSKNFEVENTYDKDGNIVTLKRHDSQGSILDNFSYGFYSGSNKVSKVMGSSNQYTYDANGNMTKDDINNNREIKYACPFGDHRNLMIQVLHKETVIEDSVIYLTYYNYDETGNRYAKTVYKYTGSSFEPDAPSEGDASTSGNWSLQYYEIYSRDVSGKIVAIFRDEAVLEYPLYGLDMVGKIKDDVQYYYYKDHLGSIRAMVNSKNELVSAQDYDPWGYLLAGRTYQSSDLRFKFTEKERDVESSYDYFGARYYDARIGNWTSIDPLMEKHYDYSPYNYVLRNPFKLVDPDGRQTLVWDVIKNTAIQTTKTAAPLVGVSLNPIGIILGSLVNPNQLGQVVKYQEFIEEQRLWIEELSPIYTTEEINVSSLRVEDSKGKHESKIRTQENIEKSARELVPGRLQKGPSWKKKLADTQYKEILKIAKEKGNRLKEAAKKMKKLIEEQERLRNK